MIAPKDIAVVVSYIMSLQGSNPPGAKAPEGTILEPAKK
jgi:hypothetical protein